MFVGSEIQRRLEADFNKGCTNICSDLIFVYGQKGQRGLLEMYLATNNRKLPQWP